MENWTRNFMWAWTSLWMQTFEFRTLVEFYRHSDLELYQLWRHRAWSDGRNNCQAYFQYKTVSDGNWIKVLKQNTNHWKYHNANADAMRSGDVFFLWVSKSSVNERTRYKCYVVSHWVKPCSVIDKKGPWFLEISSLHDLPHTSFSLPLAHRIGFRIRAL